MSFIVKNKILIGYRQDNDNTTVVIPDGIEAIGDRVFRERDKLVSVMIPSSVKSIGKLAFFGCSSLKSITIPDGVSALEDSVFSYCAELESVVLPKGLKRIDTYAFSNCGKLREITIPENVEYVCSSAFNNCHITIFSLSKKVFNLKNDNAIIVNPDIPLEDYTRKINAVKGFLLYPDKYKGEIAESYKKAFLRNRSNLLPFVFKHDLVRAVAILAESGKITAENYETQYLACMQRENAVKSAAYLLDWVNANITEEQREKAFEKQLEEDPYNPADMRKLWKYEKKEDGIHIIKYKGKDPEVYIPDRIGDIPVTALERTSFNGNTIITGVTVPESVVSIENGAFGGCRNLISLSFSGSVKNPGDWLCNGCSSLKFVDRKSVV